MTLTHTTAVDQIPSAMASLGGRLLCGVGSAMRLYDIGKRQLLRKCEIRIPSFATSLATQGWRIFMGDAIYSLLILHYLAADNRFMIVADDVHPHPTAAVLPLDYETIAVADRVGNFTVLRLPAALTDELEGETSVGILASKRDHLLGAPVKLERIADFYVGDTIVALSKVNFCIGTARDVIVYAAVSGAYGVFIPFSQRAEALLLQNIELHMRQEQPATLLGRSHLLYRSYYATVKSVIDGDLCKDFAALSGDRQHFVAQALEKTPQQIINELEDLRICAGF